MPACFQVCYAKLAEGMPPRKASRAAHFAFWQTHKMSPAAADSEGLACACDLMPLAGTVAQTLAALEEDRQPIELDEAQPLSDELKHFADLTIDPPGDGIPHVLREVRVITPGTYKGHTWTEKDLQEIEAAFDPANPPPIQMQHARSPGERYGRVRGLRMREDGWLWALCEFIGQRATEAVLSRLWDQTSAGLYVAPYQELFELSVVDKGAVTGSAIQNQTEVSTMNLPAQPSGATQAAAAAPTTPAQEAQTPAPATANGTAALAAGLQQVATALGAPAPAAAPPAEAQIMSQMQADMAKLRADLDEQKRINQLAEDAKTVTELMRAGRSIPEPDVQTKELAFIGMLSADQRTAYLELRNALPPVWPTGRTALADMTRPANEKAADDAWSKRLADRMGSDNNDSAPVTLTGASK